MKNARIFLFFLLMAAIGTVAHECGHYIAGLFTGFRPTVHYMYTMCLDGDGMGTLTEAAYVRRHIVMTLGGPLQTILTGCIGVVGLLIIRRKQNIDAHNVRHLFWITLAYFFSRNVFNTIWYFISYFYTGYWSERADESKLLHYLYLHYTHWPSTQLAGYILLLLINAAVLAWVTFVIVKQHRWQLILWGFLGSMAGYVLWIYILGPLVLP